MRFDTMSVCFLQITYSYIAGVCKLFLCSLKPIHALLASKRRLIDLQLINENEEISELVQTDG